MSKNTQLQFYRGLRANLPVLSIGEFAFCTDTVQWFTGTSGGNRLVCPFPVYDNAGNIQQNCHAVKGTVTLPGGGMSTITLTGSAVFTSATSYVVLLTCTSAKHSPQATITSGTAFNISGSGGDTINYLAIGN